MLASVKSARPKLREEKYGQQPEVPLASSIQQHNVVVVAREF